MRLSKTLFRLSRIKHAMPTFPQANAGSDRLSDLTGIPANPGNLGARCYVSPGLEAGAPLVVVLHGCTQDAGAYDRGSGWSQLADRNGFALLFPQQKRGNNPNLCFNWFEPDDAVRDKGEAASIAAMIERMAALHGSDRSRVFITGLSAGGAMAAAMLSAYPELFAGGAIIAGIPFGCASGMAEAFGCMGGRGGASGKVMGARIRAASAHGGPWPRISVWHGSGDHTVAPGNADALVAQWLDVHGLNDKPSRSETVDGYPRRVWTGPGGEELVEQYSITGLGHGTPIRPGSGDGEAGEAGPHMIDAAISSTDRIAAFWGIAAPVRDSKRKAPKPAPAPSPPAKPSGVQATIEDALKTAGLLR